MRHALLLALRYMLYYRLRSAILVVCVSIALFLPLGVHVLVGYYERIMTQRADHTPLVIGAKGSAYDLVLGTLFFKRRPQQQLTMAEVRDVGQSQLATPIPMYLRYTAGGHPIVGTTLDYFAFRKLDVKRGGTLPQVLGQVVLGATVARRLQLGPGDKLLSDQEKVYDISSNYPLLMHVAGVLEQSGTADDVVIFADVKTAWIIEGIGHGHLGVGQVDPTMFRGYAEGLAVMSGRVKQYNEITPETLDGFHFHGEESQYPVTAIIALPHDSKSATILKARYRSPDGPRAEVPREVVRDMMDIVFRVKSFFDAVFLMVLISTALFLVLVVWLSLRIRQRELQTLQKIGCSRSTVFAVQAGEIALLLAASVGVAGGLLGGLMWYVVHFDVLL